MADVLFPVTESPEFTEESTIYDSDYKKTVAWDFEKGDFILNGRNQMEVCDGVAGFKAWCVKMAFTERGECLAYDEDIGVELNSALDEPNEAAVEVAVERTITEALSTNPRTEYVRDFSFEWDGDSLSVEFTVKGVETDEFKVRI